MDLEAAFAQSRARLDQGDEDWYKLEEEGDQFTVAVVDWELREGKYGPYGVLHGVTEDGGEITFGATHSIPFRELSEAKPQPGDVVSIRYQGQKRSEKGNLYHSYRVSVVHTNNGGPELKPTSLEQATDNTADALEKNITPEAVPFVGDDGATV